MGEMIESTEVQKHSKITVTDRLTFCSHIFLIISQNMETLLIPAM